MDIEQGALAIVPIAILAMIIVNKVTKNEPENKIDEIHDEIFKGRDK